MLIIDKIKFTFSLICSFFSNTLLEISKNICKSLFHGKLYEFLFRKKEQFFGNNNFKLPNETTLDKSHKRTLLLPIRLVLGYLVFTLLLYIIGPFNWITYNPFQFYSLQFSYLLFLWLGYRIGIMRKFSNKIEWSERQDSSLIKILQVLIILNFIVFIINVFRDYAMTNFDIKELLRQMFYGVTHMGESYQLRYERLLHTSGASVVGGSAFSVFNYLWAFFEYSVVLLGVYYFNKIKMFPKIILISHLVFTVFFYLSIGTNIGVFRVIVIVMLPLCIKVLQKIYDNSIKKKTIFITILSILVVVICVCAYFIFTMKSRGGINYWQEPTYNVGGITVNKDSILFAILPPALHKLLVSLSAYLTQGYYAMSLALTTTWTPMFGLGSSMVVVDNITKYIYNIDQFTYQAKLVEFGWDSRIRWHSIYTWLANDFSFIGVILIMFVIGYLLGAMYKDAIITKNPFAKCGLFFFCLLAIFIPCNNQLAQGIGTMFSFVAILVCWIISKHQYKWINKLIDKLKR